MLLNQILRDLFEPEVLRSGENGCRKFEWIGGCQNELHEIRRLFKGFKQRVERLIGKHMHFVDNEDLKACGTWFVFGVFDEVFDIIDPAVAGRIHFDDVHMAVLCCHNAVGTLAAGVGTCPLFTQKRFGKYPCRRSLSAATKSRKKIGMGEASVVKRKRECL